MDSPIIRTGIKPYDLITDYCPHCGTAKSMRAFLPPSGCGPCDEVRAALHRKDPQ
jgi:uncharacterized protein (DUF983 family)